MAEIGEQKIWRAGTLTYTTTGIILLFIWLLWGDFAWGLKERSVGYVAGLMVKSFGISDFVYTIMMVSFPCFTNIFLMPIISYRSDRHRGRWGRRIPFLMQTTPFVGVGLLGLGFTPMLGAWLSSHIGPETLSLHLASLLVFGLFWIILDFGTTLTNAIFVALANDVVPTELIGRFLALFRAVSLICAMIFNAFLLGYAETHSLWIFTGLGIFYCIGLYSICFKVKEGEYPQPPADEPRHHGFVNAVRVYFRECFSMPYYRWVILAQVCCSHSVLPLNTFVIFYARDLGLDMGTFGKITAGIFFAAVLMSFGLGFLADKFHPIRTGIASISVLLVIQISAWFMIRDIPTFVIFFVAHELTMMAFNTLMASYTQRLFPKALYAQYNSALQMLLAIAAVLIAPVVGVILDALDHDYVYVFILGASIGLVGLFSLIKVYRYYLQYGGDKNYQAPIPVDATSDDGGSR